MAPLSHPGSGSDRQTEAEFTIAVCELLEGRGREDVASWAYDNANNSRALGPADVAREEGLVRAPSNVRAVADAIIAGYEDQQEADR